MCVAFSAGGITKPEWVTGMARDAIVFACANPVPEIWPWEAKEAGARIVATGRSDFPNQVNNSARVPRHLSRRASMCGHGLLPMRWRSPPFMNWRAAPGNAASMRTVFCRRWRSGMCRCAWRWNHRHEGTGTGIGTRERTRDQSSHSGGSRVRAAQRSHALIKQHLLLQRGLIGSHHRINEAHSQHEPLQARHRPWWVSQRGRGLRGQSRAEVGSEGVVRRREGLGGFQASRFAPRACSPPCALEASPRIRPLPFSTEPWVLATGAALLRYARIGSSQRAELINAMLVPEEDHRHVNRSHFGSLVQRAAIPPGLVWQKCGHFPVQAQTLWLVHP